MTGPTPTERGAETPASVPTLAQRIKDSLDSHGVGLPVVVVSRIVSDVAAELDRLHEAGRTHGDVQPTQIEAPLRGPARLRGPSAAAQAPGSVGPDVAGLVAAAYSALCGEAPSYFQPVSSLGGTASGRLASSILVSPNLHRPDLPTGVSDVLMKGLSPQPESRYATAGAFAAALQEAAGASPSVAPLPGPMSRKRVILVPLTLAACLAVVAGVRLGSGHQGRPSPPVSAPAPDVTSFSAPSPSGPTSTLPPVPPPDQSKSPPKRSALPKAKALPRAVSANPTAVTAPPPSRPVPSISVASSPPKANGSAAAANRPLPRAASPRPGYARVYARQFLSARDVLERRLSPVNARRVLVDGSPSQSLALGQWTLLPPGNHKLAFYPVAGVPYDPNTKFWVTVRPGRRHSFLIPLPRHPGGIQGPNLKKRPLSPV